MLKIYPRIGTPLFFSTVNSIKLGIDCNWVSCGCNAANLIKVGSRTYESPIYSSTLRIGMHVCITIYLDLNHQTTTFAANLLRCRGGSKNPITFKIELSATIVNRVKAVNYYWEVSHLSYGGFHGSVSDN